VAKSGAASNKSGKGHSSKNKSSVSKVESSVNKSQSSNIDSNTSMSQTGTNLVSTDIGDFSKKQKVEFLDIELPDTMLTAIKIIERLLTQSKYHEQHVAYRAYPPVDIPEPPDSDEEEANKKGGLGIGIRKKKE
jgi:hypothetical protein